MVTEVALSAVADHTAGYCVVEGILAIATPVPQTCVPPMYQCTFVPSFTMVSLVQATVAATPLSVEVEL
jgi:hypothetical protein